MRLSHRTLRGFGFKGFSRMKKKQDKGRVLAVIYTERSSNIRIISCRKAAFSERKFYEKGGD